MTRLVLRAAGVALAAHFASAEQDTGAVIGHTALLQLGTGTWELTAQPREHEEALGGSPEDVGYAFEKYDEGSLVEGKMRNGEWVPCVIKGQRSGDAWDIHLLKTLPGYALPGVPAHLLRRRLSEGESDWHVDNSQLQHKGFGVAYRRSKNFQDVALSFAPWNSLVVGRDEGDGWLKTSHGYLPILLNGETVLSERPRAVLPAPLPKEFRDWYLQEEAARRKAAAAKEALQPPPLQHYDNLEEVRVKTKDGGWRPAQVASRGLLPDTYNLFVGPSGGSKSLALGVFGSQLQKTGPPKHTPVEGEDAICQKQGCLQLVLRAESGREYNANAVMGFRIQVLMREACGKIHEPWESCQTRMMLSHGGRKLSPSWHTYEAGLTSGSVVDMKLAPETATPIKDKAV